MKMLHISAKIVSSMLRISFLFVVCAFLFEYKNIYNFIVILVTFRLLLHSQFHPLYLDRDRFILENLQNNLS